jgi:metallo-beta-lactamase class B
MLTAATHRCQGLIAFVFALALAVPLQAAAERTGTIRRVGTFGFGIVPDDDPGTRYAPDRLPAEMQVDGLRVVFAGAVTEPPAGARLWGTPFRVASIRKAEVAPPVPSPKAAAFDTSTWTRPAEPFRVIGPIHYVGTADLGVWLVTTPQGHILVDGALAESAPLLEKSIRSLGFDPKDIKVLVTTQAHFDHVGTLAHFQRTTGAQVAVMDGDVGVLASGGRTDYLFGERAVRPVPEAWFTPVKVDRTLKDGDTVTVGDVTLTARKTPGHTPGSTTWLMKLTEDGRPLTVAFAASTGINSGTSFVKAPSYPGIADDYARALQVLGSLRVDVPLGSHAGFFEIWKRREAQKAGAAPNPFIDPDGFQAHVAARKKTFEAQLAEEKGR